MADIKWIKISVDMFDDEKIKLIEKMPDSDTLLVIWVKLLSMAGKKNSSGWIFLTENIPYNDEMLATVFDRELNTVRMALKTFEQFGMINRTEENMIKISNWEKHQSVDRMESIKANNRLRKQKERRKKELMDQGMTAKEAEAQAKKDVYNASRDSHATLGDGHNPELELERELEGEGELDKNINNNVEDQDPPTPPPKKTGKKKREYDKDSTEYMLANRLYQNILKNNPDHKEPDLHKWADKVRLMMERDNRTEEQIRVLIDWVQQDSFWMSNILSTAKLREKWDQLVMQYRRELQKGGRTYEGDQRNRHHAGSNEKNSDYAAGAEDMFRK